MKLQRTTLILIFLALGLGSFVYFYEIEGARQRLAAKAKQGQIFSFEEDQIQSFAITTPQQNLRIERVKNPRKDEPLSQWRMKAPVDAPASDASVSYLLNLLVKGKSDRTFLIGANQLQTYGLDKPQATLDVKLKNQPNHQLILGKRDYNGNFVYAQADLPNNKNQQLTVLLVPVSFEYAVKRPLAEWKATPSPSPTPSKIPGEQKPGVTPSPSPTQSKIPTPQKSGVTPSPSPTPSKIPAPQKPGVTPSPSPTQSGKPAPQNSNTATPSASPTPSNKPAPPNSGQATPSPSAS